MDYTVPKSFKSDTVSSLPGCQDMLVLVAVKLLHLLRSDEQTLVFIMMLTPLGCI